MEFNVKNLKTDVVKVMNEQDVYNMLLPSMFTSMVMRLNIGESMHHYDTGYEFKRIK